MMTIELSLSSSSSMNSLRASKSKFLCTKPTGLPSALKTGTSKTIIILPLDMLEMISETYVLPRIAS